MHVAVDHARQQMQAAAVDHLAGGGARQVADRRKPAGPNAEVAGGYAVLIDHGAALEDQVVGVSHSRPSGLSLAQQRLRSAASSGKRFGMKAALLPDRGVVKVAGDDARRFLNGLASNDMGKVAPGQARFAALLTPQGKIIVDFIAAEAEPDDGGGFFLDCPRALAATLVEKLNFYKLRAKIAVENLSDALGVMAVWDGAALSEDGLSYPDPRLAALGHAQHPAAATRRRGRRRTRRDAHRCRGLRRAPHRARRAARRHGLHLWRHLSARSRHGPARRRRFRQRLLCRAGGGVACRAPLERAQPHPADRL